MKKYNDKSEEAEWYLRLTKSLNEEFDILCAKNQESLQELAARDKSIKKLQLKIEKHEAAKEKLKKDRQLHQEEKKKLEEKYQDLKNQTKNEIYIL